MLQQYNSLVVDASYINKFYTQSSVLGKGRDFYSGIPSICYLMSHVKEGGRYILQVYENLGLDQFRTKVLQLQKVMLECVNQNNTRILLLGEKEINDKQSDLYVLYQLNELEKRLDSEEQLSPDQAKELLITFCKNLLINGRQTYEFLDLAPQNIYVRENKYVISNMGISYKGSKFHRPYVPSTDSFNKEKTLGNMIYSYSFQAGLVTLCAMTKIHSSEFFFDDGQLKDSLIQQVLKALREKWSDDKKKQLKKQFPSLNKVEKPFDQDYKAILPILSQLLSLDQSKRSIFQLLICHPENPLQVEHPFFQQSPDVEQKYVGFGKLDEQKTKIIPHGYGAGKFQNEKSDIEWHYGEFNEGKLGEKGTIEIRGIKSTTYLLLGHLSDGKIIVEMNKYIYIGAYNEKNFPNGDGLMLYVLQPQKHIAKKRQINYFLGTFDETGRKVSGTEYYRNKSDFDGAFQNDIPHEGLFTYGVNHFFDGILEGHKRKSGKLFFGDQAFEGTFENDKVKDGILQYPTGAEYQGQFRDGQRWGHGKFTFPNQKVQYEGHFENDTFHGKGTLTILKTKETLEVEYEFGKCKTDLPENFKLAFQKDKPNSQTQKQQQQQQKQQKQQKQNDDEQIEEDIDGGIADDDGHENYDMDDQDGG